MVSFTKSATFDCHEPLVVAAFWAAAPGSNVDEDSTPDRARLDRGDPEAARHGGAVRHRVLTSAASHASVSRTWGGLCGALGLRLAGVPIDADGVNAALARLEQP